MTNNNGPRRSARLIAKAEAEAEAAQAAAEPESPPRTPSKKRAKTTTKKPSRSPIKKAAKSSRKRPQSKKPSPDLSVIEEELSEQEQESRPQRMKIRLSTSTRGTRKTKTPRVIEELSYSEDDESSDGDESSESSSENSLVSDFAMDTSSSVSSTDEYNERAPLSYDQIEYRNSHNLQPHSGSTQRSSLESHDSRLGPGNLEYQDDGFVVADEETLIMEHSESESGTDQSSVLSDLDLEINMNRDPVRTTYQLRTNRSPVRLSSLFSSSSSSYPTASSASPIRRVSSSAASSRLFYTDPEGDGGVEAHLPPWADLGFQTRGEARQVPLIVQASEEVVEEIMDAVAMFSRRVNRGRDSVVLRLAAAVLEDSEVKEALEDAVRAGLARKVSLEDGSKRWSIGAKGRR